MSALAREASRSSDESLVSRASAGNHDAFEELVARHHPRVYRLAYRLVGNDQDALDITQEVFLRLLRTLRTFRGDSRFSTWLYRVATNAALMHLRSRKGHRTDSLEQYLPRFDGQGTHCGTPEELQVVSRVEEVMDRQSLARRIASAIERLPEGNRVAFVLHDLEELPTAEVAEALGLKPATVRQRVHRARLMLRGYLSDLAGVKP